MKLLLILIQTIQSNYCVKKKQSRVGLINTKAIISKTRIHRQVSVGVHPRVEKYALLCAANALRVSGAHQALCWPPSRKSFQP
jgi:hypothetical protein